MPTYDPFKILPAVQSSPVAVPQDTPAAQSQTGQSTSVWARYAQVGAAKVQQLNLTARMLLAAHTNNPTAYRNASQQNNQNNAKIVQSENQLPGLEGAATVFHGLRGIGAGLVDSATALPNKVNKNVIQPIVNPQKSAVSSSQLMKLQSQVQQLSKQGKVSGGTMKLLSQVDNPQAKIKAYQMITNGSKDNQTQQFLKTQQKAQTEKIKSTVGAGLNTASLVVGGGQAKGLIKGGEAVASNAGKIKTVLKGGASLVKKTAPIGAAGAAGNVGATLQANPNATGKQLVKAGAEGYAGGAALGVAGKAIGKAGRMVFGKEASANTLRNVATNQLLQKGEELNKPTKISVSDQSSGATKGTVSSTLPKSRVPISVKGARPSDAGYTDVQFRLQFNKGAKQVVRGNPDVGAAFLKTGSKDPLTLTVHALAGTASKSKVASSVQRLLPDIGNTLKNQTVRDIQKTKDPQEVAHVLWDAAKTHEARVNAPGTPMGKSITFSDRSAKSPIKSELSSDLQDMASKGKIESTIKTAKTNDLKLGSDTASGKLDTKTVAQYKADIEAGKPIAPLVVSKDSKGTIFVQDGAHRLQAAKELGVSDVPVVHQVPKEAISSASLTKTAPKGPSEAYRTHDVRTSPNVEGAAKTAGSSLKIEKSAVEQGLTKRMEDLPEYSSINKKSQAAKVADLINTDRQKAIDIIEGRANPPDGIHPVAIHNGLVQVARKEGNAELITKLAQSNVNRELSKSGQSLSMAAERDPHDPVEAVRQVMEARAAAAEKRLKQPATKAISSEVKQIRAAEPKVTKMDWNAFIQSIKC